MIVSSTFVTTDQIKTPIEPAPSVQINARDQIAGGGSSAKSAGGLAKMLEAFFFFENFLLNALIKDLRFVMTLQTVIDREQSIDLFDSLIPDEYQIHQPCRSASSQFDPPLSKWIVGA